MTCDNGEMYKGQWKSSQKHGEGQYSWPKGNSYKGWYKSDKRQGFGVMRYKNGQSYEGQWVNGVKQGEGIYHGLKSDIKGLWRNGDLV